MAPESAEKPVTFPQSSCEFRGCLLRTGRPAAFRLLLGARPAGTHTELAPADTEGSNTMPLLAAEPICFPDRPPGRPGRPGRPPRPLVGRTHQGPRREGPRPATCSAARSPTTCRSTAIPGGTTAGRSPPTCPCSPGTCSCTGTTTPASRALESNQVSRLLPVPDQARLVSDLRRVDRMLAAEAPVAPGRPAGPGPAGQIIGRPVRGADRDPGPAGRPAPTGGRGGVPQAGRVGRGGGVDGGTGRPARPGRLRALTNHGRFSTRSDNGRVPDRGRGGFSGLPPGRGPARPWRHGPGGRTTSPTAPRPTWPGSVPTSK